MKVEVDHGFTPSAGAFETTLPGLPFRRRMRAATKVACPD
jgi:hypothetical protein